VRGKTKGVIMEKVVKQKDRKAEDNETNPAGSDKGRGWVNNCKLRGEKGEGPKKGVLTF